MENKHFFENIDYRLLRKQKADLFEIAERFPDKQAAASIHGVLNLLDELMDTAVDDEGLPEGRVFGP